jgi:hypothetical protein
MMNRKIAGLTFLLTLSSLISGCGQVAYRENDPNALSQNTGGGSVGGNGNTPITGSTGTTTTTTTNTTAPSYQYSYILKGSDPSYVGSTKTYTVDTDSVLQVTVKAGYSQPAYTSGGTATGFTAAYSCEQITVTALGQSATVLVTNLGSNITTGPCNGAQTSQTVDFSGRLGSGHHSVAIKISNAIYDNCRQYGYIGYYNCGLSAVYGNSSGYHEVAGTLTVTTNTLQ